MYTVRNDERPGNVQDKIMIDVSKTNESNSLLHSSNSAFHKETEITSNLVLYRNSSPIQKCPGLDENRVHWQKEDLVVPYEKE